MPILIGLPLAACSVQPGAAPSSTPTLRLGELSPYWTPTGTATPTPTATSTPTSTPTITATPVMHAVATGETMSDVALLYGISLEALLAANPGITPELLHVGAMLVIPGEIAPATPTSPAPTPLPLEVGSPACYPDLEGGAWCFSLIHNTTGGMVESLNLRFRLAKDLPNGETWAKKLVAAAPLNFWQPDDTIPMAVYFSPPLENGYTASAELISALPFSGESERYKPTQLEDIRVELDPDGMSLEVMGECSLADGTASASQVLILAAAYDQDDNLVGLRRWESGIPLAAGKNLPFSLRVYSLGEPAVRADVWAEAQP